MQNMCTFTTVTRAGLERGYGQVWEIFWCSLSAGSSCKARQNRCSRADAIPFIIALQYSQLERDNNDFNKGIVVRKEYVTGNGQSKPLSPSTNEHCARQGHRYNADVVIDGSSVFTVRDQI